MQKKKNKHKITNQKRVFSVRLILCILLGIAILANMVMIFRFSSEDSEASGDRSHGVTEEIVEVVVPNYDQLPTEKQKEIIEEFHLPIRKLAHFSEFGLLGVLTAAFMNALGKGKKWLWWVIPAFFCLLYAISDELHQLFTGRVPAVKDVLIDFCGSLLGVAVINLILLMICHGIRKRKEKRSCV